jgi:hypothetical protein
MLEVLALGPASPYVADRMDVTIESTIIDNIGEAVSMAKLVNQRRCRGRGSTLAQRPSGRQKAAYLRDSDCITLKILE